jgi:hypothetical protein
LPQYSFPFPRVSGTEGFFLDGFPLNLASLAPSCSQPRHCGGRQSASSLPLYSQAASIMAAPPQVTVEVHECKGKPKGMSTKVALHRTEQGKKEVLAEHTEAVRSQLTPEELEQCDDAMICRYIRATNGDLKHVSCGLQEAQRPPVLLL